MRNFLWSPWANPRIEELKPGPAPHFYLVGGLEHHFFPYIYILGMSSSQLTNFIVFQRGRSTTNQLRWKASRVSWRSNPIQSNAWIILIQGILWSVFFPLWTNPRLFWTRLDRFIGYIMLYHVIPIISKKCTLVISCYIMSYHVISIISRDATYDRNFYPSVFLSCISIHQ